MAQLCPGNIGQDSGDCGWVVTTGSVKLNPSKTEACALSHGREGGIWLPALGGITGASANGEVVRRDSACLSFHEAQFTNVPRLAGQTAGSRSLLLWLSLRDPCNAHFQPRLLYLPLHGAALELWLVQNIAARLPTGAPLWALIQPMRCWCHLLWLLAEYWIEFKNMRWY